MSLSVLENYFLRKNNLAFINKDFLYNCNWTYLDLINFPILNGVKESN